MELCQLNKIEWKNQTFTQFISELRTDFFDALNGRIKFTVEERLKISKRFNNKCNICKCCIKDTKFDIDHIRSLSNGGTNEKSNLQPLCKACHMIKTSSEHETGQYIKINDTDSTFNTQVQEIMNSPLSQTHAFVEKAYFKELEKDKVIYSIDINKCRKNILYYGDYDYCVFTVFDKVEEFKGTKIRPGLYYVETDNYMPLRGNSWVYHNMICYCLENNIIKLENIKYVIKSSLSLKKDYYNKFIDYCYTNIKDHSKLAINSMIGNFKPNLNKREKWHSKVFTNNSCDAFNSYIKYKGCFIDVKTINDIKYFHTFEKSYSSHLETQAPIYSQILQQEQIELHKLGQLIKAHSGVILDYNTDAINCVFPDNIFPFKLVDEIQLNGHYWDKSNTVYKYKIEYNKERLKVSRMQETMRTDIYKDIKYYNWNVITDETARPEKKIKELNTYQNTFYKFDINERYSKYEMKCQELQQALEKEIKVQPKLQYFNSLLKREYQIETQDINCNNLNEDYNRHIILNHYHEYLLRPLLRQKFDFNNLDRDDKHVINNYYYEYLNKFNILRDTIIKSNQSYFITGPGGSGKTTLLNLLQDKLKGQNKKYVTLCPTNLSALLVDGITIHKFAARLKKQACIKSLDLDYIFIDEVSMLAEVFYKFLMMIKRVKSNIKFIISGDYNQLKPVNDRISHRTDYSNAPCLFELADYNKIQLTKCRRADDTLYNLVKFDNVPKLKPSDFTQIDEYTNDINLCFTNEKRKEINHIKMKELYNKYSRHGLKLAALSYDERSQAVTLNKGVPIICKVNNEEMGFINNQRFKIKKLGVFTISIEDDKGNKKEINHNDFQKYFLVSFASTIHSAQGASIDENYTIHEWDRMDQRLLYVSLSRSRSLEYIHIMK
jgi:5-methylcytosine-specific restriction protein A